MAHDKGLGSVYQRQSDGMWVAVVSVAGKRIAKYGKTRAEAQAKLDDMLQQQRHQTLTAPTTITLSEWCADYLSRRQPEVRPTSHRQYTYCLRLVTTALGHQRLHRLTPLAISLTLTRITQKHGARAAQQAYIYLKAALRSAVEMGVLSTNPVDKCPRPRYRTQPRRYWTVAEAGRVIQTGLASTTSKWYPFWVLLLTTGLRYSEALGLQWGDVDLAAGTIQIKRALVWNHARVHVHEPKSRSAYRRVSLPTTARIALSRFLPDHLPAADTYVFRTSQGNPPNPGNITRASLRPLCQEAGVPYISPHGLRHVHAYLMLEATHDPYATQRRLGHSHVSTTIAIYGYGTSDDSAAASALDDLLG